MKRRATLGWFPGLIAALRRGNDSARTQKPEDLQRSGYVFDGSEKTLLAKPYPHATIANVFGSVRTKRSSGTGQLSHRERLHRIADLFEAARTRRLVAQGAR